MSPIFGTGDLDRRATILVRSDTTDPDYGTREASWADGDTVFAQVLDVLPSRSDRLGDEIAMTKRPATVRMRYRSDVTQANRLRIDGEEYRIVSGPAMIGRRYGIELMVEQISTEGQQP